VRTISTRTRSGRWWRVRRRPRGASPVVSARATWSTTRAEGTAHRGATCGRCAGWSARERATAGCSRSNGRSVRLCRCGDREDRSPRRAVRARRMRPGPRRRLDTRHHVHAARGGRAAHAHPGRADRARQTRSRTRARRRVDLHDPRVLPAPAEGVSVRCGPRPALPRAGRRTGRGAAQRGVRARAEFCASGEPERLQLLATYGASGLRRMLTGVYETLRSAGRELVLGVGDRPELAERIEELREAARAVDHETAAQLLELLERDTRADRLIDLSGFRVRGDPAVVYEEARRAVEQAALDEAAARDRDLLQ